MTFLWIFLGVVYVACWIYFGLATFRTGHYWMFWIGFFIPILWIIGALIAPPTEPLTRRHGWRVGACSRRHRGKDWRADDHDHIQGRAARGEHIEKIGRRGGGASVGGRARRPRQGGAGGGSALSPCCL